MTKCSTIALISLTTKLVIFSALFEAGFSGEVLAQNKTRPIDGITDNSFLLEEAYNQEPGVVQHVLTAEYVKDADTRGWRMAFTQEWPLLSQDHQLSYTIPFSFLREGGKHRDGLEDVSLDYRYQALEESDFVPAMAPRVGLILPTGSRDRDKGSGVVGYELQLPVSKIVAERIALHLNAGLSHLPRARARLDNGRLSPKRSLLSYNLGASTVYAFAPSLHLLLEWAGEFEESINEQGRAKRHFQSILSPGVRTAVFNGADRQAVVGIAAPVGTNGSAQDYGVFFYFSLEHKFLHP